MSHNRFALPQIMYILKLLDDGYKPTVIAGAKNVWMIKKRSKIKVNAMHLHTAKVVRADYKAGRFPEQYGTAHLPAHKIRLAGQ